MYSSIVTYVCMCSLLLRLGLKLLSEGLKLLNKCRHNSNVSSLEDKLIK